MQPEDHWYVEKRVFENCAKYEARQVATFIHGPKFASSVTPPTTQDQEVEQPALSVQQPASILHG